jgi:hypothetical protein
MTTIAYCSSDDQPQDKLDFKSMTSWSKESLNLESLLRDLLLDSDCNFPHAEVLIHLKDHENIDITETLILPSHENKDDHEHAAFSKLISTVTSSTLLERDNSFVEEDLESLALSIYNSLYPPSIIISTIQKIEDSNFKWKKGIAVLKGENISDGSVHVRPLCTSQDVFLAVTDLMNFTLFSRGFIQITPYTITKSQTANNATTRSSINDIGISNNDSSHSYVITEIDTNQNAADNDGFFRYTYRKNRQGTAGKWKYIK